MPASQRQEVLNVTLAQLLQKRGVVAAPESIHYTGTEQQRQMPDVLVYFQGLRTAIEGEIAASKAKDKAIQSAHHRVETGIAHIGVGIVYPEHLRTVVFDKLPHELAQAKLDIAVVTEAGQTEFVPGTVDDLERMLRSTFDQLVKEDVVAEAVALLDEVVERFAYALILSKGNTGRIADLLAGGLSDKELEKLTEEQRGAHVRVAGLILINAMIFHNILQEHYPRLTALDEWEKSKYPDRKLLNDDWQYILDEINYYSIFDVAQKVLWTWAPNGDVNKVLLFMARTAKSISEHRTALRHDLMGRVYHRLLAEAKYLGTYYTSIPAAVMLLKLALRPDGWNIQWNNVQQVGELRIADLACGTGTLLMAAADTIVDNYVSASASAGKAVQLPAIHKQVAESILYGYDVLVSAVHLTASTLALRSPDVPFEKMNLFALPLGGKSQRLGSLEFLSGNLVQIPLDISGAFADAPVAEQVTGRGVKRDHHISMPELDLCVMNPPFVRSVGGNLLFGSVPEKDRTKMQTRLKKLVQTSGVQASITSGLGSVFAAIGDRGVKVGGRMALILPKALLSGVSWADTRQLINWKYQIDYVVVSHDAERWNFSDSTDLSEVLLVATKRSDRPNKQPTNGHKVTIINLWRNPTTTLEALAATSEIRRAKLPDLVTGQGAAQIMLGSKKAGEAFTYPWLDMLDDWFLPAAFAQADLVRNAYHLMKGGLRLPGAKRTEPLPLCPLGDLGVLGPDRRDIHDGFELTTAETIYPTFWGHDSKNILTLAQQPNNYLTPLPQAKEGRPLRQVSDLWPLAGTILLAERMRLNTQRLVAVRLPEPVLSNVWWSFAFKPDLASKPDLDKALVLWLNSTLALIICFATRDETQGAWVDFKKPSLKAMPVLDVRALTADQVSALAAAYDRLCHDELKPLPQMATDDARAAIDSVIAETLNLPDFSILRKMLGREPVVSMKRIGGV